MTYIEADAIVEQSKALESILTSDPEFEKKIQKIIGNVMRKARSHYSGLAKNVMPSDPRQAYKAVRHTVYKRILGGNINILAKKRSGARKNFEHERTSTPGQRGGNRMKRSQRTEDLETYYGSDRGFILRFLNSGTGQRTDKTRNGNRGSISARNFFTNGNFEQYAEELGQLIDYEIKNILK